MSSSHQWRSHLLPPIEEEEEEEELEFDLPGRATLGKPLGDRPPWEKVLAGKISAMSAAEKSLALEAVQGHSQLCKEEGASGASIQELLGSLNLDLQQPLEETVLFHLYGLLLRECAGADLVRRHLAGLLELSASSSRQWKGIALAIGMASASHMEVVWAVLDHLGSTSFPRATFPSPDSQQPEPSLHWKWVSSLSLLCYGQMAVHAGTGVLPWVDNIASRMACFYLCSGDDNSLKMRFLSASIMLTQALQWERSSQRYRFTQIPELIHCLLCILQKEPNFLATLLRQKIILVIVGLSSLRPSLKPTVKSRILQTCLQSLYGLPPTDTPKGCLPPPQSVPNVTVLYQKSAKALDLLLQTFVAENKSMDEVCFLLQHTEPWLQSEESHERRRAVQSTLLFLQHTVDSVELAEEATPSTLGHQIGLLLLLCRDKDEVTSSHSCRCVCLFLQLLIQQKGSKERPYLNKMKRVEDRACRGLETTFCPLVKALNRNLTVAQHTQLVLTLLHGLCSHSPLHCDLASQLLLMVFENNGVRQEQVIEVLQGLLQELPHIALKHVLQTVAKMVRVLGAQHTQETVEVMLSLCHPSERQVMPLWKALATNKQMARKVMTLLYMKLKLRPPKELIRLSERVQLTSLLALSTIYELLYIQEYRAAVRWAFAGILLGLLTQLHYLFELGAVEGLADYQEDVLDMKPTGPCRMCLEALKGLFWTTNYWEVFAYLKLLRGWELFEHLGTFTEGVTLLARAMAHYDCEVKAVLGQAVISLKSSEERDNIVAILILTEFLSSRELTQYVSRKCMGNFLNLGLSSPHRLVQAMSLKGLSSLLMPPKKKVVLLQNWLAGLLDSFPRPDPKDLTGLMEVVGDILHHLGAQGAGAFSLRIAQHLLPLFEDEREGVRGGAIFLYGSVICSGGKKHQLELKQHAFQSLVPLLFHLADSCPEVVMKTKFTFLRCAILLKWEFRKELFSKLAWGQGLGAEYDIFICMVESNFASYPQFLMQASRYLSSRDRNLKLMAMKFIGGILQDYFAELCFFLKKGDVKILRKQFEVLRREQDSVSRRFCQHYLGDIVQLSKYVPH